MRAEEARSERIAFKQDAVQCHEQEAVRVTLAAQKQEASDAGDCVSKKSEFAVEDQDCGSEEAAACWVDSKEEEGEQQCANCGVYKGFLKVQSTARSCIQVL